MTHPHLEGLIPEAIAVSPTGLMVGSGFVARGDYAIDKGDGCTRIVNAEFARGWNECRAKALAALPGGGVDKWQPIDTAPKDGTVVLVTVAAKDAEIEKGYFNRGAWYVVNNGDYYDGGHGNDYRTTSVPGNGNYSLPTHWRPLPSTPSPHEADRNG